MVTRIIQTTEFVTIQGVMHHKTDSGNCSVQEWGDYNCRWRVSKESCLRQHPYSRSKERSAKYFQIYFRGTVSSGECCRTDRADYDGNSEAMRVSSIWIKENTKELSLAMLFKRMLEIENRRLWRKQTWKIINQRMSRKR